ncbi:MAG: hypothetical protein ACK41Y_12335 [Paracoccus hibiscisoli]|uniref:hypothetical protein n=1 Tax=Paracoccus hibiscisoli TaxID=2023261 RepID=UPI00391C4DF4
MVDKTASSSGRQDLDTVVVGTITMDGADPKTQLAQEKAATGLVGGQIGQGPIAMQPERGLLFGFVTL